ncbi:MAG: hypothetical protein RBS77_02850 [Candidatus Moranbacteria bacterium]|jgi:hypothetical protein|nr:hypothetical protein [Candidatus Moranbacteria bacterium]
MDEEMLLPTEVAIRIPNHRFFIFEIYRLIQEELNRSVGFNDFLEFLDTNTEELHVFMQTRRPPRDWLEKIVRAQSGPKVLKHFEIYYGDPMLCFSSEQKTERWESREIETLLNVSGLSEEVAKTEELLIQGSLDENDFIDSSAPPDEVEITDEVMVLAKEYLQKVSELSADSTGDKALIKKNSSTRRYDMDTISIAADNSNNRESLVSPEKKNDDAGDACEKNYPIIIAPENRSRFLAGLQSRAILDLPDAFICKERLGAIELNAFDETGIVPEKWITILREEGKEEFLKGYLNAVVQTEVPIRNTADKLLPVRRTNTRPDEDELVSKKAAALAILKIVKVGGFRNNGELAGFLGLNPAACSMIKAQTMRLRISDVELVAKKASIERNEFFKKVGLEYLVEVKRSQEEKADLDIDKKTNPDPKKEKVSSSESVNSGEWIEINKFIQAALFRAGGISDEKIHKEFFLGSLLRQLSGYCMELLADENKVCIKNKDNVFEFEMGHIPF